MNNLEICPRCGAELKSPDRFCGDCGFDTQSMAAPISGVQSPQSTPVNTILSDNSYQQPFAHMSQQQNNGQQGTPDWGGRSGNKNALVIILFLLVLLFTAGGGVYWWLTQEDGSGIQNSPPSVSHNNSIQTVPRQQENPDTTAEVDLSRASSYLSEPGLKCTYTVNYPDGTCGIVERISARVVPNEVVRISEVETGVDQGEDFGHVFHYVERPDGTYYILDQFPQEIIPVLKNNLIVGQTWDYEDEFGTITWTVVDMGVSLDLGFAVFENCLLVQENNQAVGFQTITYYAPGRGNILVRDVSGGVDYYRLTDITQIDLEQAAQTVKKWSPNYASIKDDRTQS